MAPGGTDASAPTWHLALTYDNSDTRDGAGAQLQRVYGIYALSRLLGVPYIHTPLHSVPYQGLRLREAEAEDLHFTTEVNRIFRIPSDVELPAEHDQVALRRPRREDLTQLEAEARAAGRRVVARLVVPYLVMDVHPAAYEACREVSPFARPGPPSGTLRVAIHVRRGDLAAVAPERLLPNSFYIRAGLRIARLLGRAGLPFRIELHSESPSRTLAETFPTAKAAANLESAREVLGEGDSFDDFAVLPNLVRRLDEPTLTSLEALATADILVLSKSSFSYLAGLLNPRRSIVIYPRFWHAKLPSWLQANGAGRFDETRFEGMLAALTGR